MDKVAQFLMLFLLVILLVIGGIGTGENKGYKQGQIDYANGTVVYELIEQEDGQTTWQYTGGGK